MEPTRTVDQRADAIAALPRRLRLCAVRAAMDSGDPELVARVAWTLLNLSVLESTSARNRILHKYLRLALRSVDRGMATRLLATRLGALSPEQQDLALSLEGLDWAEVAGHLASSGARPDTLATRSLALHAARTGRPTVAAALVRSLSSTDNSTSQIAESALLLLCVAGSGLLFVPKAQVIEALGLATAFPNLDPGRWQEFGPEDSPALDRALSEACFSFDAHRRRGVLLGALLVLDRAASRSKDSPLAAWFGRVDHPSHAALRGALRWCRLPIAGVRSWEWLWRDDLAASALDRVMRGSSIAEHDGVFGRAPLALRPKRARRLGEVDLPRVSAPGKANTNAPAENFLPPRSHIPMLSPAARRGLPRIAAMMRGAPKARLAVLEPLLTDPDPIVRHALVRALPLRSLADLCLDADARVARSAFLAWSSVGHLTDARSHSGASDHHRLLASLTRSPHEGVRVLARVEHAEADQPTALSLAGRLKLRHRLRRDRDGAASYLAAQILGGDGNLRHQSIMLVRRLDLVARFERELIEVAGSGVTADAASAAARAAASAVAALGDLSSDSSSRALRSCLGARDGRVRANAVESLGRRARRRPMTLTEVPTELAGDEHHRVRGNAVRAMISVPEAGANVASDGLLRMLSDDREMHRAAGAWAAGCALRTTGRERLGGKYPLVLARVCEMAKFDDSPAVRRRALLAASQAQTELRAIVTGDSQSASRSTAAMEVTE